MKISAIAKKYLDLSSQSTKTASELKEIETCKSILNMWAAIGDDILKRLFDCVVERKNPSEIEAKILDDRKFDQELKYIVSDVFYYYVTLVKDEFNLSQELIDGWRDLFNSFPDDEEVDEYQSDDHFLKEYINSNKTLMYKYILDHTFSNEFLKNKLFVLKGWSSATPTINSYFRNDYCNGGGFYINIEGTGIVIDPGCNFIKNMHELGIRIFDIQYVIVTHGHIDHNASVMELQDLNYQYNSFIARHSGDVLKLKKIPENYPNVITWIVDEETKNIIHNNPNFSDLIKTPSGDKIQINEIRTPDLAIDTSEIDSNALPTKRFLNDTKVASIELDRYNEDLKITCFRTYHSKNSYGICLKGSINNQEISIGFPSDTGYFNRLPSLLHNCTIIVENISELAEEDLSNKTKPTANHLKLNGCIRTISNMKPAPKLALISEFWGGKDDIRLFIVKRIREGIKNSTSMDYVEEKEPTQILAADIGLTINLSNYSVRCSSCGNEVSIKKIVTVQNEKYGRLKYVCEKCQG